MSKPSIYFAFLVAGLTFNHAQGQSIGSGNPGLKVVTNKSGGIAIYQDEPQTFGVGLQGGWTARKIDLFIDNGYGFDKTNLGMPEQLFPFDQNSAFSCSGGSWAPDFSRWDYARRMCVGYRVTDGHVARMDDVQREATANYHLIQSDVFLGFVGNKVFYWKNFDPKKVYWRDQLTLKTYCLELPQGVIDLFGAVTGVKSDISILAFSKSRGFLHYAPYTHEVLEIKLSRGIECRP